MILNGNQRGGAKDLARHLEKDENDHVEVYELRGFVSDNLMGALNEIYAISRGTQCKQFMYSLSLNPPPHEHVKTSDFLDAIERAEKKLNLEGQARAIVFHEKEGRRHAHAVWSRIDIQAMKAIPMSFDYDRLRELSRELFLEHGWTMPRGLVNSAERDPKNFTHEEWQQAKRIGKNPREIKTAIQDAWAISDSKAAFIHALQERGFMLARGDRGRFVAVDLHGEVHSLRQKIKIRVKQFRQKLGDEQDLYSVEEARTQIANNMLPVMQRFKDALKEQERHDPEDDKQALHNLVAKQRAERQVFFEHLKQRQKQEAVARQARFRTGLKGLWDFMRGENRRIRKENEQNYLLSLERDAHEKDQFITNQLSQRQLFRNHKAMTKAQFREQREELKKDIERFKEMRNGDMAQLRDKVMDESQTFKTERDTHSPLRER